MPIGISYVVEHKFWYKRPKHKAHLNYIINDYIYNNNFNHMFLSKTPLDLFFSIKIGSNI